MEENQTQEKKFDIKKFMKSGGIREVMMFIIIIYLVLLAYNMGQENTLKIQQFVNNNCGEDWIYSGSLTGGKIYQNVSTEGYQNYSLPDITPAEERVKASLLPEYRNMNPDEAENLFNQRETNYAIEDRKPEMRYYEEKEE